MKRDFGIHFPRCFFFWAWFNVSLFRFHGSEFPWKLLDRVRPVEWLGRLTGIGGVPADGG